MKIECIVEQEPCPHVAAVIPTGTGRNAVLLWVLYSGGATSPSWSAAEQLIEDEYGEDAAEAADEFMDKLMDFGEVVLNQDCVSRDEAKRQGVIIYDKLSRT